MGHQYCIGCTQHAIVVKICHFDLHKGTVDYLRRITSCCGNCVHCKAYEEDNVGLEGKHRQLRVVKALKNIALTPATRRVRGANIFRRNSEPEIGFRGFHGDLCVVAHTHWIRCRGCEGPNPEIELLM